MTVRDDIFMALHDAIGWQEGLADAWAHVPDSPERAEALAQAKRYKAILKRRYGSTFTALDRKFFEAKLVDAMSLKPRPLPR